MNQRRLINKLLAITLIISLTFGCNFLTGLGGTPDPNQEIINAAIQDSQSASMEGAIQVEQDMLNLLREQSGARTAFGDQADAIFLQIDQARAAALEELMNQAGGQSGDAPKVSPKKSLAGMFGTTRESQLHTKDSQWKSTFGILMMYQMSLMFPDSVGNSRDENGNAIPPKREGGDPEGAVGEHYTWQPKLIGSRLEATGTFKIILNEPFPYEESAEYTLSMELCPDAQGNVPLQLSFKSRVAQPGGGAQLGVESQVTGHVNDEATLDSRDDKSTFQGARQSIQGAGDNAGTANNYFEFQQDMTLSTNPDIPSTSDGDFTRQSSETDEKFEAESIKTLSFLKGFMTGLALQYAEGLWTKGYCVEVQVLELGAGTKTVQPNSETPFTAIVRHKFENVELQVPVIAKLADGQVSVNPSGSKVPAPATFTYNAPDKSGQTAIVNLETRSKRGIAKLDVKFSTGGGWKGAPYIPYYSDGVVSGVVCDLAKPFTLHYEDEMNQYNLDFQFTPNDQKHGSVSYSGQYNWIGGSNGMGLPDDWQPVSGDGFYDVRYDEESGQPVLEISGWFDWNEGEAARLWGTLDFAFLLVPLDTNECGQP